MYEERKATSNGSGRVPWRLCGNGDASRPQKGLRIALKRLCRNQGRDWRPAGGKVRHSPWRYLCPRLADVLFLAIFASVLLEGPHLFNADGDLGRHITIGRYILSTHSIPTRDLFSHTMAGQPLALHEWIAQVIFAWTHEVLSLGGPVLVTALVLAACLSFLYYDSVRRSGLPLLSALFVLWAAAASTLHWLARPHVFTFGMLAVWTWLLERVARNQRTPAWLFGACMLVWANTHGAFLAGFAVWAIYLASDIIEARGFRRPGRAKVLLSVGLVAFAATLVNPVGIDLWRTVFGFLSSSYLVSHTVEYQSPDFHSPNSWPFLLSTVLCIVALAFNRKRVPLRYALLLGAWTGMGLYSARNIPLYAIVATPILGDVTSGLVSSERWRAIETNILRIDQSVRGWALPVLSILAAVVLLSTPAAQARNVFDPSLFPVHAVDWMQEHHIKGRIYNHFPWGGYLLYRLWSGQLVFIDGQTDFYGEALAREYLEIATVSAGWEELLAKYQVGIVLVPTDSPLASALSQAKDWTRVYQDRTAVILVSTAYER
ncbi:MAG: hypothetical protein QHH80_02100 [Anaerolineae bacterium]|nr:hypothetical protein [Anaerolineae bacterium]